MRKCSNCVHYIETTPAHCRAAPPSMVSTGLAAFPTPREDWWCAKHRVRFTALVEWLRGQFVLDNTVAAT